MRHVLPKMCLHDHKHTLFSNFARFCTPKWCTHVPALSWKTTLITWIFGRTWYPPWHLSGPPLADSVPRTMFSLRKSILICTYLKRWSFYFVPHVFYLSHGPWCTVKADYANSKCHQRLNKILIFLLALHLGNQQSC